VRQNVRPVGFEELKHEIDSFTHLLIYSMIQ